MIELTGMTCAELTAWAKENGYPSFRGKTDLPLDSSWRGF